MLTITLIGQQNSEYLLNIIKKQSGLRTLEVLFVNSHSGPDGCFKINSILTGARYDYIAFLFDHELCNARDWAKHLLHCFWRNRDAAIMGCEGSRYIDSEANWFAIDAECINTDQSTIHWWYKRLLNTILRYQYKGVPAAIINGPLLLVNRKKLTDGFSTSISSINVMGPDLCLNNQNETILALPRLPVKTLCKSRYNSISEDELTLLSSIHGDCLPILLDLSFKRKKIKKNEPLVSIIIPVYNYGNKLHATICSALHQDYTNIEIIIVNDGSINAYVLNKLKSLKKNEIFTVISQRNQGPSAARNFGIQHSSGKYVLPLDSDDQIKSGYVRACVKILQNSVKTSPVYCDTIHTGEMDYIETRPEWSKSLLISGPFIVSCAMFSREAFDLAGGYDEDLKGWEDYDLWLRMMKIGFRGKRIPKPLFIYFHHESDGTISTEANKDIVSLHQKILKKNNLFSDKE